MSEYIKFDGETSYLGKDIREWCENTDSPEARAIKYKYFTDYKSDIPSDYFPVKPKGSFEPKDDVYYTIKYISERESVRICGNLSLSGYDMNVDWTKTPNRWMSRLYPEPMFDNR